MRWAFNNYERIKIRRKWLFDKWSQHLSAGRAKPLHHDVQYIYCVVKEKQQDYDQLFHLSH